MPVSGGTTRKLSNAVLAPAQERVALLVARELELGVQLDGVALGEVIDLHRVIDDELDRLQRVDRSRIAAEPDDAVAHRREIDDRGHAGEVLQQHARRREGDLLLDACDVDVPAGERLDVVRHRRTAPSSRRSRFSSRIFSEYGSRATPGSRPSRARAG